MTNSGVLEYLMPENLTRIVVYHLPISMRLGTTKLRSLCRDELGIEPDPSTAFLFVNKGHDTLLLYSIDPDGDRTLTKRIEKGAFIMPAPGPDGAPFTILRPSLLPRMFRS